MPKITVRTGMPSVQLTREQFVERLRARFYDPEFDADTGTQEDVRNAARALVQAVKMLRRGELKQPDEGLHPARPK